MAQLTVTVTPGKIWAESSDPVTIPGLNQTASPTVVVTGNLANLNNVANTSPSNGQPLVYSTGTGKWGPGNVGISYVGNGSPVASLFLRGDGNWADPTSSNVGINLYLNNNCF